MNIIVPNAPVILSRFDRYVVPTLLTPTFRRIWCWFRLSATLCHDVLRCCYDIATPELRYCPVLTRLTSDTGKFSCVVLRYVSLPPSWSFTVATLSYAVSRIWRDIACHNVSETWHNGVCIPRTFLHVSATPQSRCTTSCYAIITLAMRCCYVILRCGKRTWISNMFKIQVRWKIQFTFCLVWSHSGYVVLRCSYAVATSYHVSQRSTT